MEKMGEQMNNQKDSAKGRHCLAFMVIAISLLLCTFSAAGEDETKDNSSTPNATADMLFTLLQIQANAQGCLNDLDMDVANASRDLSATGLEGAAADEVLRKLLETNSNLVEVVTFSKEGKIISAECKGCEGGEGADISSQEHIAHVLKDKTSTFSRQFLLVEGYNGTALAYPVFSPQGEFLGGISTIIEPDKMLNNIVAAQLHFDIENRSNITDYSFWMMDLEGLIAYDRDVSQIGKYLFEDPLYKPYPSLLALGERMIKERSGHGYYSFQVTEGDRKVMTKESYWTTVGLHGREWRLIFTKMI
jgi:polar amino acid transport system substrate-binding protein